VSRRTAAAICVDELVLLLEGLLLQGKVDHQRGLFHQDVDGAVFGDRGGDEAA
jgi:hypothetical protein